MQRTESYSRGNNLQDYIKVISPEAIIWTLGLILVASSDPYNEEHLTFFLPDLLFGIKSLGYNLGHSIAFLFRLQIAESFNAHPLGIPAVLILCYRIFDLNRKTYIKIKTIRSTYG